MKISVLTASYNYARYIGETIESVLAQTFTDWEMIIVDDGSSDNSLEVIQSYAEKDSRIKVFTHPDGKNHGLSATLQLGLEKARGEWIAFLESDDQFTPTSLEEKYAVVQEHPEVVLVFTDVEFVGENGYERLRDFFHDRNRSLIWPCRLGELFYAANGILSFSTVLVAKKSITKCRFTTPVAPWLDYYLWAQLSSDLMFYLDRPFTRWRGHSASYNQKCKNSIFQRELFKKSIANFVYADHFWIKLREHLRFIYNLHRIFICIHLFRKEIIIFNKEFKW